MDSKNTIRVGIISDTHGLLRTEVVNILADVNLIIHAGDIDTPNVLTDLKALAPVVAVRGNMDRGGWADELRSSELVETNGINIYVLHDLTRLDLDPLSVGIKVIVNGHTHKPLIYEKNNILYFNPGSAGYRCNNAPLAVGILTMNKGKIYPKIIQLKG
jgi:putative phosphoesterase